MERTFNPFWDLSFSLGQSGCLDAISSSFNPFWDLSRSFTRSMSIGVKKTFNPFWDLSNKNTINDVEEKIFQSLLGFINTVFTYEAIRDLIFQSLLGFIKSENMKIDELLKRLAFNPFWDLSLLSF